jgi:hypothetical protein
MMLCSGGVGNSVLTVQFVSGQFMDFNRKSGRFIGCLTRFSLLSLIRSNAEQLKLLSCGAGDHLPTVSNNCGWVGAG